MKNVGLGLSVCIFLHLFPLSYFNTAVGLFHMLIQCCVLALIVANFAGLHYITTAKTVVKQQLLQEHNPLPRQRTLWVVFT